jgi:oxygen-dependent protoporphyrinogen oxidase
MFGDRAPKGFVSISCYFGGARRPDLATCSADELIHLARTELFDLLGARGEPVISKVRHWPRGLPAYELGHTDKVEQLKTLSDRQPGLFITGNHMTGVSVEMCTALANKTAAGVDYYLANMAAMQSRLKQIRASAPLRS